MENRTQQSRGRKGANVVVGPHRNGWQVKRMGNQRASRVTATKREAETIGRKYARKARSELVIQSGDGRIRESDSHGYESPVHDKNGHR